MPPRLSSKGNGNVFSLQDGLVHLFSSLYIVFQVHRWTNAQTQMICGLCPQRSVLLRRQRSAPRTDPGASKGLHTYTLSMAVANISSISIQFIISCNDTKLCKVIRKIYISCVCRKLIFFSEKEFFFFQIKTIFMKHNMNFTPQTSYFAHPPGAHFDSQS